MRALAAIGVGAVAVAVAVTFARPGGDARAPVAYGGARADHALHETATGAGTGVGVAAGAEGAVLAAPTAGWQTLEAGLELGMFEGPPASVGARPIVVLRIDPAYFELRLMNASAPGEGASHTARGWVDKAGGVAAINASMYQEDYRTSVSLMQTRDHVNHPRLSKDKAILAFDPMARGIPAVRLIDRECHDLDTARRDYGALVQSIRLVSCDRRNVWAPSARRFSTAAIGTDAKGRVLFIHARTPWPVHDLVNALLALPIELQQAMYVEGGPEAQLFVRAGDKEMQWIGGFEAAPAAENTEAWPVPNVVVAVRKTQSMP
jgi:hypothetical protein